MDAVAAWFARQADRERRAVLLEDALLAGRFFPYVLFRLRFWLARYGLASVVQVVQVLILHRLFPREGFLVLVGLLAAAALVTSAWWGVLEVLRTRVRDLYQSGVPHLIPAEIGRWLSGALRVGLVCAVGAAVVLAWRAATAPQGLGPVDVAAAAILLRLAVDLPRRCYHSGLYALRRIYRPLPSMLVLEVVSVGALLALVPWLGPWAAPVAELVAVALVTSISVAYTARGYRLAGLSPHRHIRILPAGFRARRGRARRQDARYRGRPVSESMRAAVLPGAAAALMSLDSMVVLGVFAAVDVQGAGWPFALLVAAAAPSVRAGFDWSQLLYFDLKRLERRPFANLRATFVGRAIKLAPILGLGFWVVGGVAGTGVLGPAAWQLELGLLPFFIGASLLAIGQMDAFSAGAYRPVVASGAAFAAGLLALAPLSTVGVGPAAGMDVAVFVALGTLLVARRLWFSDGGSRGDLMPAEWLGRLGREPGPVRVSTLRVGQTGRQRTAEQQRTEAWRTRRLARRIGDRLGGSGAVARFGEDRIAWYEREDGTGPSRVDDSWLLQASGGRLGHLQRTAATEGAGAVSEVAGWALPGPVGPVGLGTSGADPPERADLGGASTTAALLDSFGLAFPTGVAFSPDRPLPPTLQGLAARERRMVLSEALRYARGLPPSAAQSRYDVTAYSPSGALELIFLVERSRSGRDGRARWRAVLRQAHLAAAVAPTAVAAAPSPAR